MKKKLSVILIFALVFSLMGSFAAPASAAVSNLYGDLNGDGVVASADSVLMKRYLAEWNVTIDTLEAGDLNGDGNVTSADSVILSRYLAKWEFENKVGTPIVVGLPDITVTMTLPEITVNNSAKISCDVKTFGTPELSYVYVSENPDAVSVSSDGTVTAKTTAPTDVTVYVRAYYEKEGKTLTGTASVTVKAKDASEKVNVLDSSRKELFLLADTSENGALDTLVSGISDRLGMDASVSSGAALGSGDYSIVLDLKTATAESLGLTAAELNSDGFMLKASGNTLYILANNPDGADRAVRFVLNNYAEEENHTVSVPSDLLYTQSVGYKIKHLTIASNSIADYTVVCPADASESMVFAAKELVSYIKKATGVELPIVQISASDKVFELAAVADESYGDDGFTIKTENGKVLISGAAQKAFSTAFMNSWKIMSAGDLFLTILSMYTEPTRWISRTASTIRRFLFSMTETASPSVITIKTLTMRSREKSTPGKTAAHLKKPQKNTASAWGISEQHIPTNGILPVLPMPINRV